MESSSREMMSLILVLEVLVGCSLAAFDGMGMDFPSLDQAAGTLRKITRMAVSTSLILFSPALHILSLRPAKV